MFTGTVATGGIPVDLHTLAVSIVSKKKRNKLKCNEPRAVKGNLSDLPLGEVVDWGMVSDRLQASLRNNSSV